MARPVTGTLTVLGVHPLDPTAGLRRTPVRDALINRAATRTGIQSTPTLVMGDFNAAPWDGAMRQFAGYANVTRVRCGGWLGTTYSHALGIFGLAVDHAFTRDLRVLRCQIGGRLPQGRHSPLWLTIAPQAATPSAPVDPAKD
jgi:endonuclease/exonuclease/phosphatase (EEP) superfamily protein YafD